MRYLSGLILLLLVNAAWALKTVYIPVELQTKNIAPVSRKLHVKMPLQQTDTDWVFTNAKDLLAGSLELRIIRNNQIAENVVIFNQGKFAEGWSAMVPPVPTAPGAIYFGFVSTKPYYTAPSDRVELRLQVVKAVKGIGPQSSGILPQGLYVTSGSYSGLIDNFPLSQSALYTMIMQDNLGNEDRRILLNELYHIYGNVAFMNAWNNQWQVAITTNSGWLDEYSQPEE
jgi:hypothetical protein